MMTSIGECGWCAGGQGASSDVLAWDGRIDNRDDLFLRLGHEPYREPGDATVALAAYQRRGVPGLGEIIGDWSVVIRDASNRTVVLASDFAGVRPLYYHRQRDRILWSARLDLLADRTGVDTLDDTYIAGFLACGGCPNRTPYAGIYSVPPGQAVCISEIGSTIRPFWTPPYGDVIRYRDERRYDEQLRALFHEAVAVRLRGKAPALAELSGGLDSSSVVCMAHRLIRSSAVTAPRVTTVSYVHRGSLDLPFIREVEATCELDGVHLSTHDLPLISTADVGAAMPEGWRPLHRSVAAVARRVGAGMLLTGQNGDLATGNWFDDSLQVAAALRRGRLCQASGQAFAWSRAVGTPMPSILVRAARAALPSACAPRDVYAVNGRPPLGSDETSIGARLIEQFGPDATRHFFSDDWLHAAPERRKHFRALTIMRELRTLQRPDSLREIDVTHPFAHRPLLEFLMSVPADVLCRAGEPRRLMRRALGDLWPPMLRRRRSKSLFAGPWSEALRSLALDLRKHPRWHVVERGWVDRASLTARIEKLAHGLDCNASQLKQIILLECWLRDRERCDLETASLEAS